MTKKEYSRRLLIRYVTAIIIYSVLAYFAAGAIAIFSSWKPFFWMTKNHIYQIFNFLAYNEQHIKLILMFSGDLVISLRFLFGVLKDFGEIADGAKSVSEFPERQLILHQNLKGYQDELNSTRERFLEKSRLSAEAEIQKKNLLMYLAHDLKTPLSSVIGYLNLLSDEPKLSDEQRKKYINVALKKSERLEELINEFFEITRFESSEITLEKSKIDLSRMIEQIIFEFSPMLSEKGMICKADIPDSLFAYCDGNKLQRVFDNLLKNGALYGEENSEIIVKMDSDGKTATVKITNIGKELSQSQLGRLFDRFYRVDASRSSSGGSGLGLAIAKRIINLHGGDISAESENGKIIFTFTIPLS